MPDIDLNAYDPEDVIHVKLWIEFITDVIEVAPRTNGSFLRMGLDAMIEPADAIYPKLTSIDGVVIEAGLTRSTMGDQWCLPDELGEIYARLTGRLLFLGEDGPRATAPVLRDAISSITTRIAEARGYTVEPVSGEALDDNDEVEGI